MTWKMRLAGRTTLLGVALIAIAMLNLTLVDGIGLGLVREVEARYESLGADWMLAAYNSWWSHSSHFDPVAFAQEMNSRPEAQEALVFWYAMNFHLGQASSPLRAVISGPQHTFEEHPYLFLPLQSDGGQSHRIQFVREAIHIDEGRLPRDAGEVALDREVAEGMGVRVGDQLPLRFQTGVATFGDGSAGWQPTGPAVEFGTVTLTGIATRERLGNDEENYPILLVAHSVEVAEAIQSDRLHGHVVATFVAVQANKLSAVPAVIAHVQHQAAESGLTTELWEPTWLQEERNPQHIVGARTGGARPLHHISIFTDHELLSEASDAAAEAGQWYRILAIASLVLATIGVIFVASTTARKIRERTGVLQALGFSPWRITVRAASLATSLGALGGLAGGLGAATFAATGLGPVLLGVPLGIDLLRAVTVGATLGALLNLAATIPLHIRALSASPSENLRASAV